MASSFISKDDVHGFWIYDDIFQVVCRYIELVIIKFFPEMTGDEWIDNLLELLDKNAKGLFHSYMHLNLDEFITNDIKRDIFNSFLEEAKVYISKKGEFIPLTELTVFYKEGKIDYEWKTPIKAERLIKVLNYLQDVVNDKIKIKVGDKIDYSF